MPGFLRKDEYQIGCDENGYGTLAGNLVVTAALCRSDRSRDATVKDSKKYGKNIRKMEEDVYRSRAYLTYFVSVLTPPMNITQDGMSASLASAYTLAVCLLRDRLPTHAKSPQAIIDGDKDFSIPDSIPLVHGDDHIKAVSMASCIGKIIQVTEMLHLHKAFPAYGFDSHHGYGSKAHIDCIKNLGAIPDVHRMRVVRNALSKSLSVLKVNNAPYHLGHGAYQCGKVYVVEGAYRAIQAYKRRRHSEVDVPS